MTTSDAVSELVTAAWHLFGGVGPVMADVRREMRDRRQETGDERHQMNIYIAGKITGLSGEEAEANFMWAEMRIAETGHTPLNPLKLVDQGETNADGTPRTYGDQLTDALRIMLNEANGVYFLDNWRDSDGARIESFTCQIRRIPRYYDIDELPKA